MKFYLKEFIGIYYLLFGLSFLCIYFYLPIVPAFSIVILLASYYLIIVKQRFDVVIALIFYSRCINGFVVPHNSLVFSLVNFLTSVFPVLIYFAVVLSRSRSTISMAITSRYKFTLLLFLFLTVSFVINITTSYDIITKRYLPFLLFVVFLVGFTRTDDFNTLGIIRFFRAIFLSSIVVFLFSDYLDTSRTLMESDIVFSKSSPSNTFSLVYFGFTRNLGPAWDHRILGIMAYLYLLISLVYKPDFWKWDVGIALVIVVTALSRGAILTFGLIMLAYLFQKGNQRVVLGLMTIAILAVGLVWFSKYFLTDSALEYLQSFNPKSEGNAFDQRAIFAEYALEAFKDSPILGNGAGFVTSRLIDRSIVVDGAVVTAAGDAFWYIVMAEFGVVGTLLYGLFLMEVFWCRNLMLVALLVGFAIQLLGTDIPDTRFYFFGFLVMVVTTRNYVMKSVPSSVAISGSSL